MLWFSVWINATHSVEKRKIHCHTNFFPSNQFIVKLFSKRLIWRNFCENIVAENFHNFHCVCYKTRSQVERKNLHFFRQNKEVTKVLISRNCLCISHFLALYHTVDLECVTSLHWENISRKCNFELNKFISQKFGCYNSRLALEGKILFYRWFYADHNENRKGLKIVDLLKPFM